MKRYLIAVVLCLTFGVSLYAQQNDDTPASREDVQTYFETVHSRDSMNKLVDAMLKPMHEMIHDQYVKHQDKLPADFEARMTKQMDDMYRNMPFDEMIQAMIPVYQKHFTKGDIYTLLAFYSSPTGQKMLNDMPAIMGEAMEAMMPTLRKYVDEIHEKLQRETDEMIKDSEKKSDPAANN